MCNMSIETLVSVVPPPLTPASPIQPDMWESRLAELGARLPDDAKAIALTYGSGGFADGEIKIFTPIDMYYSETILRECNKARASFDLGVPYSDFKIFPDSPGLYPCGADLNGNRLYWHTVGSPNEWPIVIYAHGGGSETWNLALGDFLSQAISNQLRTIIWKPFPRRLQTFRPTRVV